MDDRQKQMMLSGTMVDALGHQGQLRTQREMQSSLEELARAQRGVAKCPWCGGPIPKLGVGFCMHCSREIGWAKWMCCKPEEVDLYLPLVAEHEAKALEQRQQDAKENRLWLIVFCLGIMGVGVLALAVYFVKHVETFEPPSSPSKNTPAAQSAAEWRKENTSPPKNRAQALEPL